MLIITTLIATLFFFAPLLATIPPHFIDGYLGATTNYWQIDEKLLAENVQLYLNGKSYATNKKEHSEIFKEWAKIVVQYENNILFTQTKGENLMTVQRKTSMLGRAGCLINFDVLDLFHFNKDGKLEKHEFFSDKSADEIVAQVTCKPIFPPEKVVELVEQMFDGKWLDFDYSTLQNIVTDDVQLDSYPPGKASLLSLTKSAPYKKVATLAKNVFVTGNSAYVPRFLQFLSKNDCLYSHNDVVKVTFSYPDGKIAGYEHVTVGQGTKDRCAPSERKEL